MSDVIVKKANYDYLALKKIIFEMMDALGGGNINSGARILIKPNLLCPAKPQSGIQTHPFVTMAVAEYLVNKGFKPQISDSPALGSFQRVLKEGEYQKVFGDLDVKFASFTSSVKKDIGPPFGEIDIAADALAFDIVINLAKLKTHSQMLLTLGVKNLFGCIVGMKKPEWHLRAGVDRDMFAKLLIRIHNAVSPFITIIDGILAMEGQGPSRSGIPRELGILVGSRNAWAADMAVCNLLGVDPKQLPTHKAARTMGLVNDSISIDGHHQPFSNFRLPIAAPLTFGPQRFQGFIRKHLLQRPIVDPKRCKQCGECWNYCPASAISKDVEPLSFNYSACIRCYCCIEVCPHGALSAKETIPGRFIRGLPFVNVS